MFQYLRLTIGLSITLTLGFVQSAFAAPLLREIQYQAPRSDTSSPFCYIQIQGSEPADVSSICGNKPSSQNSSKTSAPVTLSPSIAPPPPNFGAAATAGQCNFLDASGKPCPKKEDTNKTPEPTNQPPPKL